MDETVAKAKFDGDRGRMTRQFEEEEEVDGNGSGEGVDKVR